MKQTVNFSTFIDAFRTYDRYDQFGYEALTVLFDFLEEYENDTGVEMELDVIALCCEFTVEKYGDIAENYGIDLSPAEGDEDDELGIVMDYLSENTIVCGPCDTGIVYQSF